MPRVPVTITAALLCAVTALLAGCGGSSSSDSTSSAFAFLPADTPFVATVETDTEGEQYDALTSILDRFPGGASIIEALQTELEEETDEISFEEDIEPALGNPMVLSATDVATFTQDSADDDFVAALQVADEEALERLIEVTEPTEEGEVAGATVYEEDFAVDGDMVVFAGTSELLEEALERADSGEGFDAGAFDESQEGLPEDALARVYFDVEGLIENDPETEQARSVPWVAALTSFGMTLSLSEDTVSAEFNLRSDGEEFEDEELPLASGDESPQIVRDPERVGLGIRDPAHIARFFENTFALIEPDQFAEYESAKPVIAEQFGVDLDADVFEQLTGDLSVSLALDGSFSAQAELNDAAAFAETLASVADALPAIGSGFGVTGVRKAGTLYEVSLEGGETIVAGTDGDLFVAGNDLEALREDGGSAEDVPEAEGSLVISADAEQLALQAIGLIGSELGLGGAIPAGPFIEQLGELVASLSTSADGMRGKPQPRPRLRSAPAPIGSGDPWRGVAG